MHATVAAPAAVSDPSRLAAIGRESDQSFECAARLIAQAGRYHARGGLHARCKAGQ